MKVFGFILLLFLNTSLLAQNFTVNYDFITWAKDFNQPIDELYNYMKQNPALRDIGPNGGQLPGRRAICEQRGTAIFMRNPVSGVVTIEETQEGYRIIVDSFRFKNQIQINLGSVETDVDSEPIEAYLLKKKDRTIRKNKQALRDLNCLNQYLSKLFTPK